MRHRIAITMGDPAGIGAEIAVKLLSRPRVFEICVPVVVGDAAALEDAIDFLGLDLCLRPVRSAAEAIGEPGAVEVIDLGLLKRGGWAYGAVDKRAGEASFRYVVRGIELALAREVDAVVTGPINKEAIHLAGHRFSGHTEIFAHYTNTCDYAMLLISDALRVMHATTHVSMREACDIVRNNPARIERVIALADEAMRQLGIPAPRVAVAGLNAHSSENGLFGDEEALSIAPAVERSRARGLCVEGPLPPDTIFVKAMAGQYDVVVAMYHDQGHIPLKLCGFKLDAATNRFTQMSGINVTVGLPIIRTSVDHGTAYDRAGRGIASEMSLFEAVEAAVAMADRRFPL